MKQHISILSIISLCTLTFAIAGCSKEEAAPVEEPMAVEAEAPETTAGPVEGPAPAAESLEVVEESAAEAEPAAKAIILAQVEDAAAARSWQFKEGAHYTRMIPTQRTVGGADKIEVAEIFMYSCPHCYDLEDSINPWAENKDPNIRFVRIPAIFNQLAQLHAQLYYTEVFLAQAGKLQDPGAFREMVFQEYHRKGNRLTSETAIQRLFARAGVSEDDFGRTWNSFEVDQALRVASDLARRYNVTSVPMIVVNGKYSTSAGQAGSYPKLIELIDELTVREGLR